MSESAVVQDRLRGLVLPLERLSPAEAAQAIRTAGDLGRQFGDEFRACVLCLLREGRPLSANPRAYAVYIVEPWGAECGLAPAEVRRWAAAFDDGTALRDPRVQAFCGGLAARAWEIAAEVERSRDLVARYLEVPVGEVSVCAPEPQGAAVLGMRDERFVVVPAADAVPCRAPTPQGCPAALGVTRCRFLDHWILRWREGDPTG